LLFDLLAGWLAGYLGVVWMQGIAWLMDNFCWIMVGWLVLGYWETVGCWCWLGISFWLAAGWQLFVCLFAVDWMAFGWPVTFFFLVDSLLAG
jgi:hypothetical protein